MYLNKSNIKHIKHERDRLLKEEIQADDFGV